jgi:hypothetical protein
MTTREIRRTADRQRIDQAPALRLSPRRRLVPGFAESHHMVLGAIRASRRVVCHAEPEPGYLRIADWPPAGRVRQLQKAFR